jgi:acyl-coenzyme A thioesterase PaaI-like protein
MPAPTIPTRFDTAYSFAHRDFLSDSKRRGSSHHPAARQHLSKLALALVASRAMPAVTSDREALERELAGIASLVDSEPAPSSALASAAHALQSLGRWVVSCRDDPEQLEAIAVQLAAIADRVGADHAQSTRWLDGKALGAPVQANARQTHPLLGRLSPVAPPLLLRAEGDRVVADVCFDARFEGNLGWAHGGFIAAGFDIVLVQAVRFSGASGPTGSLSVRYREPTPTNTPLAYTGWFERAEGRKLYARAELRDAAGLLLADAEGIVIALRAPLLYA